MCDGLVCARMDNLTTGSAFGAVTLPDGPYRYSAVTFCNTPPRTPTRAPYAHCEHFFQRAVAGRLAHSWAILDGLWSVRGGVMRLYRLHSNLHYLCTPYLLAATYAFVWFGGDAVRNAANTAHSASELHSGLQNDVGGPARQPVANGRTYVPVTYKQRRNMLKRLIPTISANTGRRNCCYGLADIPHRLPRGGLWRYICGGTHAYLSVRREGWFYSYLSPTYLPAPRRPILLSLFVVLRTVPVTGSVLSNNLPP